ncbi:TonB-dependent receptor [Campylobacter sp. CX2-8023-23]|uniref:TonB-dependent receptor domain-containing protein n=1 Tax=Campylobacter porcelli TaxID=1660073 RepID=UPI002EBC6B04|nr:TonB-dependent receptor [Campylobacter sp. CX2-8023-23]
MAVLDKSVVSASGFAQSIKDAPATISIIGGDEIQNRPIRDLGDIVQDIPGVSTEISKTGSSSIKMRGMASKYTLILVDGKRINMDAAFDGNGFDSTSGFLPPVSMIEKVEVIRGPASLIYGSDAMGGVINIITKKNVDKASATISLETRLQEHHNTWGNMYGLNGNVLAPLGYGFTLSLRGKYYDSGQNKFYKKDIPGYVDTRSNNPYTSHSPTGYVNYSLGGKLNYDIDGANSVYLDSEYGFQRLGSLNTSSSQITVVHEYHKYDNSIGHSGEYQWGKTNSYIQYALTEKIPHIVSNVGDEKGEKNRANRVVYDNFIISNQNMMNFDYNDYGSLILNFGPYLSFENLDNHQTNYSANQYTIAGYAEGEYLFNEYISTTLGGRVNHIITYGTFFNPRAYLNVYPTDLLTLKFGISSGLKAPDLGSRYDGYYSTDTTTDRYGNNGLDVERTLSYELSAIYEWLWADISATAYYTQFNDAISTQTYQSGQQLPNGYGDCGAYGGAFAQYMKMLIKLYQKALS